MNSTGILEFSNEIQTCRLCGKQSNTPYSITSNTAGISVNYLQKKIGIRIKVDDGLPTAICKNCVQQINNWQKFVQNCLDIQGEFGTR